SIGAIDIRPNVRRRGPLGVRVTKLEGDFRIAHREAIHVAEPPPQNERVMIKPQVGGISERDFSDAGSPVDVVVGNVPDVEPFRRAAHQFLEIPEAVDRGEAVRLQNEFRFEVTDAIILMTSSHRTAATQGWCREVTTISRWKRISMLPECGPSANRLARTSLR